jgi:hypothetical protein
VGVSFAMLYTLLIGPAPYGLAGRSTIVIFNVIKRTP